MLYYRVKPQYDNHKLSRDYQILVGTELYTPREMANACTKWINRNTIGKLVMPTEFDLEQFRQMFDTVMIPKTKTYWFFGARFAREKVLL